MIFSHCLRRFSGVFVMVTLGIGAPAALRAEPADIVLVNGRIVTLDETSSISEALAIAAGRIAATGSADEMRKLAGPATKIIDLNGRTVIPGLIDSHIHSIRAGFRYAGEVHWDGATSIGGAMERLRSAAMRARPGAWLIVAGGWTPRQFTELRRPTEAEITAAAREHPVYIQLFYGSVLLNASGREMLGIHSDEDLPLAARFERDGDGMATGWILGGGAAITTLYSRLPKPQIEEAIDGTRHFLRELSRLGLTGVIDPGGHNLSLIHI